MLTERWSRGGAALGAWCMIPDALAAEALASQGFDWICIDMQHGCMDYTDALAMIRAVDVAGSTPVVRVPWNEPGIIGRMLDAGAAGLIIPMIESVDDARRAVDAARYPPLGRRSFGPIRVGLRDGNSYAATANERVMLIPMIETRAALAAAADIMALPGVDAAFIGPYDLSIALGLPPGNNDGHAAFDDALATVVQACHANDRHAAILGNAELAPRRIEQGFSMVSVTTDIHALIASAGADLARLRGH